eukprot:gene12168-15284_t
MGLCASKPLSRPVKKGLDCNLDDDDTENAFQASVAQTSFAASQASCRTSAYSTCDGDGDDAPTCSPRDKGERAQEKKAARSLNASAVFNAYAVYPCSFKDDMQTLQKDEMRAEAAQKLRDRAPDFQAVRQAEAAQRLRDRAPDFQEVRQAEAAQRLRGRAPEQAAPSKKSGKRKKPRDCEIEPLSKQHIDKDPLDCLDSISQPNHAPLAREKSRKNLPSSYYVLRRTDDITGKQYAIKSLSKRRAKRGYEFCKDIKTEVEILYHLGGHPSILKLHEVYEDDQEIHLVMELCKGGDWFEELVSRGTYTEGQAASTMRTLLEALAYCHSLGVVHRDIKPENILLVDSVAVPGAHASTLATETPAIKLADFGLSSFIGDGEMLHDTVGTSYYVAPEVLDGCYDKSCDIWSCGVSLFIVLGGYPPFNGPNESKIFESTRFDELSFNKSGWDHISKEAKDIITRMLQPQPPPGPGPPPGTKVRRRISQNKLATPQGWECAVPDAVVCRLQQFAAMNQFKKEARKFLASCLPEEEVIGLLTLFRDMDEDGDGVLTTEELRQALDHKGIKMSAKQAHALVDRADMNRDGMIDYEEFLAATIHESRLEKDELLYKAFKHFDADNSGFITAEELQTALSANGTTSVSIGCVQDNIEAQDEIYAATAFLNSRGSQPGSIQSHPAHSRSALIASASAVASVRMTSERTSNASSAGTHSHALLNSPSYRTLGSVRNMGRSLRKSLTGKSIKSMAASSVRTNGSGWNSVDNSVDGGFRDKISKAAAMACQEVPLPYATPAESTTPPRVNFASTTKTVQFGGADPDSESGPVSPARQIQAPGGKSRLSRFKNSPNKAAVSFALSNKSDASNAVIDFNHSFKDQSKGIRFYAGCNAEDETSFSLPGTHQRLNNEDNAGTTRPGKLRTLQGEDHGSRAGRASAVNESVSPSKPPNVCNSTTSTTTKSTITTTTTSKLKGSSSVPCQISRCESGDIHMRPSDVSEPFLQTRCTLLAARKVSGENDGSDGVDKAPSLLVPPRLSGR